MEQVGFKLAAILLPLHLQSWDYRNVLLYLTLSSTLSQQELGEKPFLFCPYAFVGQRSGFVSSSPLWVPRIRFRSSDLHGMSHLYSHAICIRRHTNLYYSNPLFCKRYWNSACLKISKCMNQSSQNAHFNSLGQEVAGEGE